MSWPGLLQSLHSALIDEITERCPDPMPELGTPRRENALSLPTRETGTLLASVVTLGSARGLALLALDQGCETSLGAPAAALWEAVTRRSEPDLARRGITARLERPAVVKAVAELPEDYPRPKAVVWIPIRIHAGLCHLGLGA